MNCKICHKESNLFDHGFILNKYNINYYRCPHCGFIQTEDAYWLDEAYSSAIANTDIGLIQRNIDLSQKVNYILKLMREPTHLLDYGAGYGMFVRMMRDKGWNFEWYDEYCENLFAQHHEMSREQYDIVTSFEMLEHLPSPLETLDKIFKLTGTFICTTELTTMNPPKIKDWWYYAPETGQHVAFYTKKSLQEIANLFKKNLYAKHGIIIFSDGEIPTKKINLTYNHPQIAKRLFGLRHDRPSLLSTDYFQLTGKRI